MSLSSDENQPWSGRRWGWTVGLMLVSQIAALWLMTDRHPVVQRKEGAMARLRVVNGTAWEKTVAPLLAVHDPTLFALAGLNGFSGAAWMNHPQASHQLTEWHEGPRWLFPRLDRLGAGFSEPSRPLMAANAPVVDKPPPLLAEVTVAGRRLPTNSLMWVEGNLAERPLMAALPLPVQTGNELVTNSEVKVVVDGNGRVFSAALLRSCGLPAADRDALNLARAARFRPSGPAVADLDWARPGLVWGRLVFQWYCAESSATNTVAQKP